MANPPPQDKPRSTWQQITLGETAERGDPIMRKSLISRLTISARRRILMWSGTSSCRAILPNLSTISAKRVLW
jgi:hypothetical protein